MRFIATVGFVSMSLFPSALSAAERAKPAVAQPVQKAERSPWSAYVAGGLAMKPDFPGSKDYQFLPFAMAKLSYEDYYVELVGPRAKVNVIPGGLFEAGPVIGYDGGRDSGVDNRRVRLLPKVDGSVEFGGFAAVNFKQVFRQTDTLSFAAEFTKASAGHEGYTIGLQTSYGLQVARPLFMSVDAGIEFADKKYLNAYFGVSQAGAAASGLSPFSASAGVSKAELGLNARYFLSKNWGVTGRVAYGRLLGDAAKSPIVKNEGSQDQFTGAIGAFYRF